MGNYKLKTGNIFAAADTVETIVVPVNCSGEPDSSAIRQCRIDYPKSYARWSLACRDQRLSVGNVLSCEEKGVQVLFLPVRQYSTNPIRSADLVKSLDTLIRGCNARQIGAISMPIHFSRPLFSACTEAAKKMDRTNVYFYREAQAKRVTRCRGFSRPVRRNQLPRATALA